MPQNIEKSFIKTEFENDRSIDKEINKYMSSDICKYETLDLNDFRNHVASVERMRRTYLYKEEKVN